MDLKKLFLLMLIVIVCSVSVVSAADVNNNVVENTFDTNFYDADDSMLDEDYGVVENTFYNNFYDFDDSMLDEDFDDDSFVDDDYEVMGKLASDIRNLHPGDVYNLKHNYFADFHRFGIDINVDNVTIDGKGHVIDGNNMASIFNVNANNVKIMNLNIINSFYDNTRCIQLNKGSGSSFWEHTPVNSPVCWNGDKGVLYNCSFVNTRAVNGGAVNWMGNNGLIINVKFINNTATGVGGSLCIGGTNNVLFNSAFVNSTSRLSHEMIFFDRNRNNNTVLKCGFDNGAVLARDGKQIDFNASNLLNRVYSPIFGKTVNLCEYIYLSLLYRSFVIDDSTIVYATFEKKNYILNFQKNCGDGVVLTKQYTFSNVFSNDDIFKALYECSYSLNNILVKNVDMSYHGGSNCLNYDEVRKITANHAFANIVPIIKDLTYNHEKYHTVLNVNFLSQYDIYAPFSWNVADNSFDIVKINGHGSKIYANAGPRDEYKAICVSQNNTVSISDLTIEKFNTAIENLGGSCILNNVVIKDNKMDYWIDRDWGAGMLNTGYAICNNCTFTNNYAKNGGAIFTQGHLIINNCTFNNNKAYGKGNDVCVGDDGTVEYNGKKICKANYKYHRHKELLFAESISIGSSALAIGISATVSFCIGAVAGTITANPIAGAIVGASAGAIVGGVVSGYIISEKYDVNYDRTKTAIKLVTLDAVAGAVGGLVGGYLTEYLIEDSFKIGEALHPDNYWVTAKEIEDIKFIANSSIGGSSSFMEGLSTFSILLA